MKVVLYYLLNRLKEPSTWRGIILCLTAFGMQLSIEQGYAIASLGFALAGGVGAILPDQIAKKPKIKQSENDKSLHDTGDDDTYW